MGIIDIMVIFLLFCAVWILTNIAWKAIETKMMIRRQQELMDKIYSKGIRLLLRAIQDQKDLKEVSGRD